MLGLKGLLNITLIASEEEYIKRMANIKNILIMLLFKKELNIVRKNSIAKPPFNSYNNTIKLIFYAFYIPVPTKIQHNYL